MWGAILGSLSLLLVLVSTVVLYMQQQNIRDDVKRKMSEVVNQINDSQYYEYNFDKQQDDNLKNVDQNVTSLYEAVVDAQKNVKHLEKTALRSETLSGEISPKAISTSKLSLGDRFSLVGNGPDDWLRVANRDGTNYHGGLAAAKIWTRDSATLNGTTKVNDSFESTGYSTFKGGVSDMNENGLPTQFPNADGKNYVRGDTEIRGHVNNVGSLRTNLLKVGHSTTGWIDNSAISAYADQGKAGASFGGAGGLWSHFPWSDGNTYVRPGSVGKSVVIGDGANGPVAVGSSWLPNADGHAYLRAGSEGKNVNIADKWSPNVNIGSGNTNVIANGTLKATQNLCVGSVCVSAAELAKVKDL